MTNVEIGPVRYNPARGAFEARVDIARAGRTFRYPCEVRGPVTMDEEIVRSALASHALGMSDSGKGLFSTA